MSDLRWGVLVTTFLMTTAALSASAEPPALLSEVSARLEAARYVPVETDLHWTAWIGAGAGLVRAADVTLFFDADVETIIGNTRRPFEANQANYHLALALRRPVGAGAASLFFQHVSRHYVDRPKGPAVDWNVLGLRVTGPLPRGRWVATAGHTTLASLVGYRWELGALLEADLSPRTRTPYGRLQARLVTVEQTPELPRGSFADVRAEAGVRLAREPRSLQLFVAFERRNDVFLETPGARDRGLIGFRIGATKE